MGACGSQAPAWREASEGGSCGRCPGARLAGGREEPGPLHAVSMPPTGAHQTAGRPHGPHAGSPNPVPLRPGPPKGHPLRAIRAVSTGEPTRGAVSTSKATAASTGTAGRLRGRGRWRPAAGRGEGKHSPRIAPPWAMGSREPRPRRDGEGQEQSRRRAPRPRCTQQACRAGNRGGDRLRLPGGPHGHTGDVGRRTPSHGDPALPERTLSHAPIGLTQKGTGAVEGPTRDVQLPRPKGH